MFVERPGPYADHAAFRAAVVETTGVASLGTWLDRYVAGDALPPFPDDPASFVYGPDLDPDGDGASSGAEVQRGTNPFVADATPTATRTRTATPTPTRTATPTPTAARTTTGRDATAADGDGFGAPGAAAAVAVGALAVALAARRRR